MFAAAAADVGVKNLVLADGNLVEQFEGNTLRRIFRHFMYSILRLNDWMVGLSGGSSTTSARLTTRPDRAHPMGSVSGALAVPAKYIYGALIAYVVMAGVMTQFYTGSDTTEMVIFGLLWPLPVFEFVWDRVVNFYGRMFD